MVYIKKLALAPFFLIVFIILIFQLNSLFSSYEIIFSLSWTNLIQLIILSASILMTSLLFNLFATFSQDWKLVLPTGILASFIPMLFLDPALGLILSVGILISLILSFLMLEGKLKKYLTFEPSSLLGPSIRHLSTFLIVIICVGYFFSINKIVQTEGFQIPDSIIDTALKFTTPSSSEKTQPTPTLPSLSKEQIDLLKKNPDLLKQSGLDPSILDNLAESNSETPSQNVTQELVKKSVKDQLQKVIDPYLGFIPAALALTLFLTLTSLVSFLTLFIYPLLWIIFYLLEKTGFVKFTEEMRPVKKMVV